MLATQEKINYIKSIDLGHIQVCTKLASIADMIDHMK